LKIAVSGTHRIGKTTLTEAFAEARPEYRVECEPYVALVNDYGEDFGDDVAFESFERQLRYHCDRVVALATEPNVVFDRCAADLLAYMKAAAGNLGDATLPEEAIASAHQALEGIDLTVHLPLRLNRGFVTDAEDRSYRREVDLHLAGILEEDVLGLLGDSASPRVLALGGSTARRLERLLAYVDRTERGVAPIF
jgi:hypothetical protein